MAIEETEHEPNMDMTVSRMWYKDGYGKSAYVVKYSDPFGQLARKDSDPERDPIYVAMEGRQPETLFNILTELERLRAGAADRSREIRDDHNRIESNIHAVFERIERMEDAIQELKDKPEPKSWWNRSK